MDHLAKLVAHLGWADERALASLQGTISPPAAALELFAHVLGAEHVWLSRLRGEQPTVPVWPALDLAECARLAAANRAGLEAFVRSLGPDDLRRAVHYVNSAGQAFDSTVEDILLQVCLHGAYHRGQVAMLLRGAGTAPNPTDYIGFVRGVPAATRPDAARQDAPRPAAVPTA